MTRRSWLAAVPMWLPSESPGQTRPNYARLRLRRSTRPILEPVTKLGGQPVWVEQPPAWPRSRQTGKPLLFIGQVVVEPRLFDTPPGRIAYIFITDDPRVSNTYDPHSGENAVIIQQQRPGRQPVAGNGPRLRERGIPWNSPPPSSTESNPN